MSWIIGNGIWINRRGGGATVPETPEWASLWGDKIPTLTEVRTLFGSHVIGAYPLNEISGTTAQDESGNNLDGTYTGTFALNQDGIGEDVCADMLGTAGVALYSAGYVSAFNIDEGFLSVWLKANNEAFWASSNKCFFIFGEDTGTANCVFARTNVGAITFLLYYNSNLKSVEIPKQHGLRWLNIGFRWSAITGNADIFVNGHKALTVGSLDASSVYTLSADHCNLFGGWKLLTNWIDCKVQNAIILDYAPTDVDIFSSVNPIGNLVFEGDSRTNNKGWINIAAENGTPATSQFNYGKYGVVEVAVDGSGIDLVIARAATINENIPSNGIGILVVWIGVNDITNYNAAQEYALIKQYCIDARTAGWKKIVICTEIDAQDNMDWHNTMWPALNALILADHSFADAVADLGGQTELKDATDVTYYNADKIHLTDAGYTVVGNTIGATLATII